MFSDYCPIISAEASNGDVIEFFSDRNEEKVSIPFWMYYHSAEVHRACRLTGPAAGVSQPASFRAEHSSDRLLYGIRSYYPSKPYLSI